MKALLTATHHIIAVDLEMNQWPNKSLQATRDGARSSAVAIRVASRRGLPSSLLPSYAEAGSFFR